MTKESVEVTCLIAGHELDLSKTPRWICLRCGIEIPKPARAVITNYTTTHIKQYYTKASDEK